ncbi:DUF7266 family protein [Halobacterium litoreum]|uniref:Flagellar protein FlaF n=1 Tax=Halobacterium litoreum TaxID=2039234 RepID=A0ABD5NIQ5_9EURY|nr:hypothetical protein [Halobacterium litoreum]UHH12141.1 hypothetical protein LT972_08230 [Halobacterium litoreum]
MADLSRGVSTTLGYVLNLGVAAILVTTLMISAGTLVEDQRERAVDTQLDVVGERVASDLEAADRLARASDGGTVRYVIEMPPRVAGSAYEVRVNPGGNDTVVLESDLPREEVAVAVDVETTLNASVHDGGRLVAVYDAKNDTLVVDDA